MTASKASGMFSIRRATKEDLAAVLAIEKDCFEDDAFSRSQFIHALNSRTAFFIVAGPASGAERKDDIAGYALGYIRRGQNGVSGRIYSIAVAKRSEGCGAGRVLMDGLENMLSGAGATAIYLEVRIDNERAIRLYERYGYKRIATINEFYHDGTDAYKYRKSIR